ncbi:sensor domain-containing diguanylate cyclase [Photobacterium aphoticum]|uniref:GGDEF domain-containing protein n=1 Tax=Photobacterium aphoticum TaxID=754436 RepID=A0A0J1GJG8_9GAMM|nr:sensor domain-containing diguanylate cyclase [Photobacterium aphoticum]KLU99705.1 hypothetical protein ABT58_16375 [Photobacterium aphoticum]GHA43998.1 GGDEF domain-containing protein [Photobacterium aphoticum]
MPFLEHSKPYPFYPRFFLFLSILLTVFILIVYTHSQVRFQADKEKVLVQQELSLSAQKHYIHNAMQAVVRDATFVADMATFSHIDALYAKPSLTPSEQQTLRNFEQDVQAFSQRSGMYDQVRFIDADGREQLRVNYSDEHAYQVAKAKLQNKAGRYYVQEGLALIPGEVYISPLDLNIEHNEIELPHKPMIRIVVPIYNTMNLRVGIVVLNYLAQYMIDELRLFHRDDSIEYMLVNHNGQFLYHSHLPEYEFAFMFGHDGLTVDQVYPGISDTIYGKQDLQLDSEEGIYTISTIGAVDRINPYCFDGQHVTENTSTSWRLVSFVKNPSQHYFWLYVQSNTVILLFAAGLMVLLAYVAASYCRAKRNEEHNLYVMAHSDELTQLHNRLSFFKHGKAVLDEALKSRQPAGLLFIDLDDFKHINDTYGHQAGDQVLRHVAACMRKSFGEQALLCRLGGDEFAVIVVGECLAVDQLVTAFFTALRDPDWLHTMGIPVSASVGGALFPACGDNLDTLMHQADLAMYCTKRAGKGGFVWLTHPKDV